MIHSRQMIIVCLSRVLIAHANGVGHNVQNVWLLDGGYRRRSKDTKGKQESSSHDLTVVEFDRTPNHQTF